MNITLSTFLKILLVGLVITALIYNKLVPLLGGIADQIALIIQHK